MHAVKEGRIGSHLWRERIKKTAGLQENIHTLIDVTDEYHRRTGSLFLLATGKGTRSHIVLHDLDTVFIFKIDPGHFVEGDTVPQADKAYRFPRHVVEQISNCSLATRDEDLFEQVALASASRPELTEVKVVFYQRNHTKK